ncbi:4Fe-4S ferredoxin [Vibrio albus]|uniref:4Fe-4S ferredoxin n=1 Tax=Vibrio albus TaxID=2200953 RepID=A0A2U3B6I7_9VIBR|nr:4Fe-4S dicluster domain-containing protein [Vibrio albus]PWI32400.1 4Fe-4S ferredoxin [Vibrio albus]
MFKITMECDSCGQCKECCPVDGAIIEDKPYKISAEHCAECGACVDECPKQAIVEE